MIIDEAELKGLSYSEKLQRLNKHYQQSGRYPNYMNGVATSETVTREVFDKLNSIQQMCHIEAGGKIVD